MKTLWNYNNQVNINKNKNLGNTYTHPYITENIIKQLVNNDTFFNNVLEPCVGTGSFYYSMIQNLNIKKIDCFDIDENSISLVEKRKEDNFYIEDFLLNKNEEVYDLIITNPPYVSYNNIYSKNHEKEEYLSKIKATLNYEKLGIDKIDIDKRSDLFIYFFLKSLSKLSDTGKLIFLCSDKWLDTEYGKTLKKILLNNFKLETIITSNYYPFFRDDTNAIVTVISKRINNEKNKTIVYSIDTPSFNLKRKYEYQYEELYEIFNNEKLNLNNKNKLLFYQEEYLKTEKFIEKNMSKLIKINEIITINSSKITYNSLLKKNLIEFEENENNITLFYQEQARKNKPANYKQEILKDELKYFIGINNIDQEFINEKSVYMATMIDRFPLLFHTNYKTAYVSKYYLLQFKDDCIDEKLLVISMNNIFTIQSLETFLKDGTKRTLRKNENGFAKEISKKSLENIFIPNILNLNETQKQELIKIYDKYSNIQISSLDIALENKDYILLQRKLKEFLSLECNLIDVINNTKNLYFKRMRNLKKLNMELSDGK